MTAMRQVRCGGKAAEPTSDDADTFLHTPPLLAELPVQYTKGFAFKKHDSRRFRKKLANCDMQILVVALTGAARQSTVTGTEENFPCEKSLSA